MRWTICCACLAVVAALGNAGIARAQEWEIPREHHAWARFGTGSWKLVRIVTENFDASGRMIGASATETKTTLKEVAADSFTLLVESTVEVAGKKIVAEPKTVVQRFNGALPGQTAEVKSLAAETLTIQGQPYACRVQQYEVTGLSSKTITKTHYASTTAPYVLRRESTTLEAGGQATTSQTVVRVTALNVPEMVLGDQHLAAHVHIVQKHAKGTETTTAVSCVRVPGGVVSHESKELDAAGNLVSQSKLELVGYHIEQNAQHLQESRRPLLRQSMWTRRWEFAWHTPQRNLCGFQRTPRRGQNCGW